MASTDTIVYATTSSSVVVVVGGIMGLALPIVFGQVRVHPRDNEEEIKSRFSESEICYNQSFLIILGSLAIAATPTATYAFHYTFITTVVVIFLDVLREFIIK